MDSTSSHDGKLTGPKLLEIIHEWKKINGSVRAILINPKYFHEMMSDEETREDIALKDTNGFNHHQFHKFYPLLIDNEVEAYEIK